MVLVKDGVEVTYFTVEEEEDLKSELDNPTVPDIKLYDNDGKELTGLDMYIEIRRRTKAIYLGWEPQSCEEANKGPGPLFHALCDLAKQYEILHLGSVGKESVERLYPDIV